MCGQMSMRPRQAERVVDEWGAGGVKGLLRQGKRVIRRAALHGEYVCQSFQAHRIAGVRVVMHGFQFQRVQFPPLPDGAVGGIIHPTDPGDVDVARRLVELAQASEPTLKDKFCICQ